MRKVTVLVRERTHAIEAAVTSLLLVTLFNFIIWIQTASVAKWSEFLATDPEVRVRFPSLPDFLRSSGSGTVSTQPREHNWGANYTDRATVACQRSFANRGCDVVSVTDPYGRILGFLDRSRYFFFQVAPQFYSWGWLDPVPDPLLLRKSGNAGNRIRTSGSVARVSGH
jgi:hypothetical protein